MQANLCHVKQINEKLLWKGVREFGKEITKQGIIQGVKEWNFNQCGGIDVDRMSLYVRRQEIKGENSQPGD